MKRIIISLVIVALLSGTCFARGWGRGGPRGYHGGGYRYNNCNDDTAMWVGIAGAATAILLAAALSQPQGPVVREVVPVTPYGYGQVPSVMVCPSCRNRVSCTSVPPGYRASCPYCRTVLY